MPYNLVTVKPQDEQFVAQFGGQLQQFRSGLTSLFQERDWLIDQVILSLMCGRSTLIYGIYGAAKTMIADAVYGNIVGKGLKGEEKQIFSIQLDSETTIDKLTGPPNVPLLESEGILQPMISGYLPTAHFAVLDEIFDAPGVLRSLNDILNERQLREGQMLVDVPLIHAIAMTNRSPQDVETLWPYLNLAAVNDRFLCTSSVQWLEDDGNKDQMILNYLVNARLNVTLNFADVQRMVEIIQRTNQFPHMEYIRVYRQVIAGFSNRVHGEVVKVSDRRLAWLTQLVEAYAIMQGRTQLYFDDIYAAAYGLCPREDSEEHRIFKQVAEPVINEAKKTIGEQIDDAVRIQLSRLERELQSFKGIIEDPNWPSPSSNAAVGKMLKDLSEAKRELDAVHPQLGMNQQLKEQLLRTVDRLRNTVLVKT